MRRTYIPSIILFLVLGLSNCSTFETDYLLGLEFGAKETTWKSRLVELVNNGRIAKEIDKDEAYYKINIAISSDKTYEASGRMNGSYEFGELRELNYAMGRSLDNKLKDEEKRPTERYNNEQINLIYSNLLDQYGNPDSLKVEYYYNFIGLNSQNDTIKSKPELSSSAAFGVFNKPKQILDSIQVPPECPKIFAKWNLEEYQVEFSADPERYFDTWEYPYYPRAYLNFKSNSFDRILADIKDSIRLTLKPADIVSISTGDVQWEAIDDNSGYDYRLKVYHQYPKRPWTPEWTPEEVGISDILVDFIITDNFGKVLAVISDYDMELKQPLTTGHGFGGLYYVSLTYDNRRSENVQFEEARIYNKSFGVRSKAIIKGIRFSDGTVLNND